MTRGRKPVHGSEPITKYKYQVKSIWLIINWLLSKDLTLLFTKGDLNVVSSIDDIVVTYTPPGSTAHLKIEMDLSIETQREYAEIREAIQDFLLECFYMYEWDGKPLRYKQIGALLGESKQAAHKEIKDITKKCKIIYNHIEHGKT